MTVLAAIAARTHLRALALYANEPQELVDGRLGGPLAEWCAAGELRCRTEPPWV